MFHKTIAGALLLAAGAAAVLLLKKKKDGSESGSDAGNEEDNEEVHFIKISDDDEEEEQEAQKYDASDKPEKVQEVCAVYPYLNPDFVEELLAKSDEFEETYPKDELINVTHKVDFPSKELRESFAQIMDASGYVNVQLSDTEMTSTRRFYVEEGALISDILNVANQAAALKGTYEGYDIFR